MGHTTSRPRAPERQKHKKVLHIGCFHQREQASTPRARLATTSRGTDGVDAAYTNEAAQAQRSHHTPIERAEHHADGEVVLVVLCAVGRRKELLLETSVRGRVAFLHEGA